MARLTEGKDVRRPPSKVRPCLLAEDVRRHEPGFGNRAPASPRAGDRVEPTEPSRNHGGAEFLIGVFAGPRFHSKILSRSDNQQSGLYRARTLHPR